MYGPIVFYSSFTTANTVTITTFVLPRMLIEVQCSDVVVEIIELSSSDYIVVLIAYHIYINELTHSLC